VRRNDQNAVVLDDNEVYAVALRLIAKHLTDNADDIADWGLIPEASDLTHMDIVAAIGVQAVKASDISRMVDLRLDIDSAYLIGQLS
jgi:hypothetical protein